MTDDPEIVVVFRSRRRTENEAEYIAEATRISDLARRQPGYISHKGFTAPDGENVTIVEFESMAHVEAWRGQIDHARAQARGRREFYSEYSISIAEIVAKRSWPLGGGARD